MTHKDQTRNRTLIDTHRKAVDVIVTAALDQARKMNPIGSNSLEAKTAFSLMTSALEEIRSACNYTGTR